MNTRPMTATSSQLTDIVASAGADYFPKIMSQRSALGRALDITTLPRWRRASALSSGCPRAASKPSVRDQRRPQKPALFRVSRQRGTHCPTRVWCRGIGLSVSRSTQWLSRNVAAFSDATRPVSHHHFLGHFIYYDFSELAAHIRTHRKVPVSR
jgi:hypothetical protein